MDLDAERVEGPESGSAIQEISATVYVHRPPPPVLTKDEETSAERSKVRFRSGLVEDPLIPLLRRHVCDMVHASDLCPAGSTKNQEHLWASAAVEELFLKL